MKLLIDPERELLERTLRVARRVEPPKSDEAEMRRRAERAVAEARAFDARRRRIAIDGGALAAAAALWVLVASAKPVPEPTRKLESQAAARSETTTPSASPDDQMPDALPSGDRLYAARGARYEIDATNLHRRVRLMEGEVRFDVARLEGGSFRVDVADVTVWVRGTVFSVRLESEIVEVEVLEGVVEVRRGDTLVRLGVGGRWSSADREPVRQASSEDSEPATSAVDARTSDDAQRPRAPDATPRLRETEPRRVTPSLAEARRLLLARDFRGALEATEDRDDPEWQLLRADALRGLGRPRDAARAYDQAAGRLADARRAQAGYAAARLWTTELQDFEAALASLAASHATRPGSPIEERARALELELLRQLGRDARGRAEEYQRRFGDELADPRDR